MICQIFALALIMGIVWYLGYRRGKTIKEREFVDMVEPTVNKFKNKYREYLKIFKIMDEISTEEDYDNFFSGDISKSSRTDTNKDEKQK